MSTIIVALLAAGLLFFAYKTYGRFLAEDIFRLSDQREVPSHVFEDGVDFVPTKKSVVFGHHFTSIAGTGPIVGPAIAVFWGWLPALLWVLIGGIFIGAVHDFGALVISLRNKGETIGQTAGRLINPRARLLFLLILFFALSVVLGIFGLVIAQIFKFYPNSVLGTWISLPLAIGFGWMTRSGKLPGTLLTVVCMIAIYFSIWLGAYYMPIEVQPADWAQSMGWNVNPDWWSPTVFWTLVLLAYCFAASVMPVWILLQPRDYLNSWQLILVLIVLVVGIFAASATGEADLVKSAPPINWNLPADTPHMFPFLFTTIACGAISGFHCLVSSGTTSKQIDCEADSLTVGYGSMLLESGLAVMVILACCAGIGMGKFDRIDLKLPDDRTQVTFVPATATSATTSPTIESSTEEVIAAQEAPAAVASQNQAATEYAEWRQRYDEKRNWKNYQLAEKVGAFIDGGASFVTTLGVPLVFAQALLAVLVACFAATTLDSATRLQRYVIQELGTNLRIKPLENRYVATSVAVGIAAVIALMPGNTNIPGTGGQILWPLFGATNQLLAGLAFLVIAFYLWRRNRPIYFLILPLAIMLVIPICALSIQLFGFFLGEEPNYLLGGLGLATLALQIWMIVEAALLFPRVRGKKERGKKERRRN